MTKTYEELSKLEPKAVWKHFAALCDIPHPSGHEANIGRFMKEFGEKLGLESVMDDVGNVVINKPATKGMEDRKTVILQAHLDMVPQKNKDMQHDFLKDPIDAYVDGDWVKAKGTTLGSDNGVEVAAIMTILESKDIPHGPLQALFTVDEEQGMTGAINIAPELIKGDILINLDSEDDDVFTIGCAGGGYTRITMTYEQEPVASEFARLSIDIKGLKGGHSGAEINLQRANANKLMNRVLWQAARDYGLRVCMIDGGSLDNAIPREASAIVAVPQAKKEDFIRFAAEMESVFCKEFSEVDPDIKVQVKETSCSCSMMAEDAQDRFLNAVYACPNGVYRMSDAVSGLVETSNNMARVSVSEGQCEIKMLQRSSVETQQQDLANMVRSVFELAQMEIDYRRAYPGWAPNMNSQILKLMIDKYKQLRNEEPIVGAIHAGLECGMLLSKAPNLDAISTGPNIRNPHSPDERISIKSVQFIWELVLEILKDIPKK